jgi:(S)-ureidoglycine aminohydrolase
MDPFGTSRSRVCRSHALIAPDSFVSSRLPGWTKSMGVVLVAPRLGAGFVQYLARMDAGATAGPAIAGVERVIFVLEGEVEIEPAGVARSSLGPGGFAYIPPGGHGSLKADAPSRLCVFEKPYEPIEGADPPDARVGQECDVRGEPFLGDPDARLQVLLPDEPAFDLAVNVFTYQPGATLPMVEVHVMEHGLLMLEGQGVYRLGDSWYPVREGDAIWMAPYCPQWFVAMGKGPSRYLYYKDVNRDPMGPIDELRPGRVEDRRRASR